MPGWARSSHGALLIVTHEIRTHDPTVRSNGDRAMRIEAGIVTEALAHDARDDGVRPAKSRIVTSPAAVGFVEYPRKIGICVGPLLLFSRECC